MHLICAAQQDISKACRHLQLKTLGHRNLYYHTDHSYLSGQSFLSAAGMFGM